MLGVDKRRNRLVRLLANLLMAYGVGATPRFHRWRKAWSSRSSSRRKGGSRLKPYSTSGRFFAYPHLVRPTRLREKKALCPSSSRPCSPIVVRIQNFGWTQLSDTHHELHRVRPVLISLYITNAVRTLYVYMHSRTASLTSLSEDLSQQKGAYVRSLEYIVL